MARPWAVPCRSQLENAIKGPLRRSGGLKFEENTSQFRRKLGRRVWTERECEREGICFSVAPVDRAALGGSLAVPVAKRNEVAIHPH